MTLHPFIFPRVRPGTYAVEERQTLTGGGLAAADVLPGRTHHLEVTAPRFSMPGNEVFGCSRRRTRPARSPAGWPRSCCAAGPCRGTARRRQAEPWLALVVLARARRLPARRAGQPRRTRPGACRPGSRATPGAPPSRCRGRSIDDAFPAAAETRAAGARPPGRPDRDRVRRQRWLGLGADRQPAPAARPGVRRLPDLAGGAAGPAAPPGRGATRRAISGCSTTSSSWRTCWPRSRRLVKTGPFDPSARVVGPTGPSPPSTPARRPRPGPPTPSRSPWSRPAAGWSGVDVNVRRAARPGRHRSGLRVRHVAVPGAGALGVQLLRGVRRLRRAT